MRVIILAGGESKRLGIDKALLKWQGKLVILRIVERFQNGGFSVAIAGGPSERAQRLKGLPAPIVADLPAHEGFGPLAGIEAGFLSIKEQTPAPLIGVVACDLPFADPSLLSWLAKQIGDADAVVPIVDGQPQPLHAVYARSCLPHLVAQLESQDKSVRSFLKRLKVVWVSEEEWQKVADQICLKAHLNKPEDLERWQISSETSLHLPLAVVSRHADLLTSQFADKPVISFVGFSGSGKTVLIEQLVQRLTLKGYKVGVVKHHHEQRDKGHRTRNIGIDVEGKDTWRYRQSGSAITALVAYDGMILFLPEENLTAEEAVERLMKQLPVDLVFVEGFKRSSFAKFVVLPSEMAPEDACQMLSQILSQIGDPKTIVGLIGQPIPTSVTCSMPFASLAGLPHFAHDEVERLCEFVEQWANHSFEPPSKHLTIS